MSLPDRTSSNLVWYFAYGSDLDPSAQLKKTVRARRVVPGIAEEWRLVYAVRGICCADPAFEDLVPVDQNINGPPVHGVAWLITQTELAGLIQSGGERGAVFQGRARPLLINITAYDGEQRIRATALVSRCYARPPPEHRLLPSRRRVGLIHRGARQAGLRPEYLDWIRSHKTYVLEDEVPSAFCRDVVLLPIYALGAIVSLLCQLAKTPWQLAPRLFKLAMVPHWLYAVVRLLLAVSWTYFGVVATLSAPLAWVRLTKGVWPYRVVLIEDTDDQP